MRLNGSQIENGSVPDAHKETALNGKSDKFKSSLIFICGVLEIFDMSNRHHLSFSIEK